MMLTEVNKPNRFGDFRDAIDDGKAFKSGPEFVPVHGSRQIVPDGFVDVSVDCS